MTNMDIWSKLEAMEPKRVALYFKDEYPQTVAVVLAHFSPGNASRVLSELPTSFAIEVAMRISKLSRVSPRIMKILTSCIAEDIPYIVQSKLGGVDFLYRICNEFRGATRDTFVSALQERNYEFADKFKK